MLVARYINRELVAVFGLTIVVLLLVALGGRFVGYLQEAALGKFSADSLGTLVLLRVPEFLQLSVPFALFLAVMLTLSRLHAEQEMSVLASAGVSPTRVVLWLMVVASVAALVVGYLSFDLTPETKRRAQTFISDQKDNRDLDNLQAGVFHTFDHERRVTYAEHLRGDEWVDVFMGERRDDGVHVSVWSKTGTHYVDAETGSRFLLLRNGKRYEGRPGTRGYRIIEFETLGQRVELPDKVAAKQRPEAYTLTALMASDSAEAAAEFHWRLALPLLVFITVLLAVGLARVKPREGRFARILPGLIAFLAYYVLLLLNQYALSEEAIPAVFGMWLVHAAFLGVSVELVRRSGLAVKT